MGTIRVFDHDETKGGLTYSDAEGRVPPIVHKGWTWGETFEEARHASAVRKVRMYAFLSWTGFFGICQEGNLTIGDCAWAAFEYGHQVSDQRSARACQYPTSKEIWGLAYAPVLPRLES